MINLFNINNYSINTSVFGNLLHDKNVRVLEEKIASYVGAKHAASFNSATSAIFLSLLGKNTTLNVPSIIPPVVLNAIVTSGNKYKFVDDVEWVGWSYLLHDFGDYRIIDSAQRLDRNQFSNECQDADLMVLSFYPTKPVGSCDGGMIVSNDKAKIEHLREMSFNGMKYAENNWDRVIGSIGYKMYMNSIQAEIAIRNLGVYDDKRNQLEKIRLSYNNAFGLGSKSHHLYRINVSNRGKFMAEMKENGIMTGIHYLAMHLNNIYATDKIKLPLSEKESETTVSIPFHEKMTSYDVSKVIEKVKMYERVV